MLPPSMEARPRSPLPKGLADGARSRDRLGDFVVRWISALAAVGVVALIVLIV